MIYKFPFVNPREQEKRTNKAPLVENSTFKRPEAGRKKFNDCPSAINSANSIDLHVDQNCNIIIVCFCIVGGSRIEASMFAYRARGGCG